MTQCTPDKYGSRIPYTLRQLLTARPITTTADGRARYYFCRPRAYNQPISWLSSRDLRRPLCELKISVADLFADDWRFVSPDKQRAAGL